MSSSSSSSAAASASASSTVTDATPKNDSRILTVAVVLSILGAILVGGIIYMTIRLKRRQANGAASGPYHGTVVNEEHPSAQITPFGSPGSETPQFRHTPGSGMRIAIRRPDGAWQFGDHRAPFTPSGVSDIDVMPSTPSSLTFSLQLKNNSRTRLTKADEVKAARDFNKAYDRDLDVEIGPNVMPPPAYGHEHESDGYLYQSRT
ncbi:hypothetical protein BDQ12DRAFT_674159 [Crucibulum laeve]|uniref:Uncharacterized protein n=1 Tax=Crucibulum laeve TaxID=68775 RepID=A0A5C3MI56_9AGAR|nr:hypothetical protein BDQ12DRAFT_674159 [Crucibulum laeve]